MIRSKFIPTCFVVGLGLLMLGPASLAQEPDSQEANKPMVYEGTVGGLRVIEEGQPPVMIHATMEEMKRFHEANPHARPGQVQAASTANDLYYHGGVGGIGVETAPKVYLVLWGSQWNGHDPSGEAAILENFYTGVGGSSWLASVTQYCQGVASGSFTCSGGTKAGNPSGIYAGVWADNGSSAPSRPRQSQIAAEAVKAAQHFGNTTAAKNASVQYVIATATGNNSQGFKIQYCAYHSSTSSTVGNVAYTNLPYITDAGASCGANFNGLGAKAGITIVSGHEMAETITDQFPNGGWLDSSGAENGDKCAWISSGQGASSDITLSTGTFPVQSLWSNTFNSGSGGCVLTYP
jgi:serine protease